MRKLVFYSHLDLGENERVDTKLLSLIDRSNPKMGYIPSNGDPLRKYFEAYCDYYQRLGFHNFFFFDLAGEFDPSKTGELLSCDVIHLSGGDPLLFLANIKKRDFMGVFRSFVEQGGILTGVSGGALQMTRTVAIYKTFTEDLDHITHDERVGLGALNLVDFEFLPHYNRWDEAYMNKVKSYSLKFNSLIYACRDGDGILVHDDEVEFLGEVIKIENGNATSS